MSARTDNLVDRVLPEIIRVRHQLHETPEIALREFQTSAWLRQRLQKEGIDPLPPFLGTDVVAILGGRGPGRNVTLRADIDALPLEEKTGLPYASKVPGMMHACGHDGHTAMLLGAGLVLNQLRQEFDGSVRLVFQPGEEVAAAGKDLVAKGALLNPEPAAVFALHGFDGLPVGALGTKPGVCLAAADFFRIRITGKGAHGSMPNKSIDPILASARVIEALQAIPSRMTSPLDPVVVSVCKVCGGTNSNIIPDSVEIEGTTRYLNPALGEAIPRMIDQLTHGVCLSLGATHELHYSRPYIPTINDPDMTALCERVVKECLGEECWRPTSDPSMGGEDFSYYVKSYPGAFVRVGMGEESPPLHSSHFNFNDMALRNGIRFFVEIAIRVLHSPPHPVQP
jgi:amidohydrolase